MARARSLKPGLFKNEVLGTADPLLTLLFESLWCLADKEGRLEDRPLRIKAETFPYRDGIDINGYLTDLERLGFIRRYEVGGMRLIEIINFAKHQKPHHTEKESELPAFPTTCHVTVNYPLQNAPLTDSLNTDSLNPQPVADVWMNGEKLTAKKPVTLPPSLEKEINTWLDAVAPLAGAKNRKTLANETAWRAVVTKAIAEDRSLVDFLAVARAEALRNKSSPQFFTPTGVLKIVQAGTAKQEKWANC